MTIPEDTAGQTKQIAVCPPSTERQTWIEIDLGALKKNYFKLRSLIEPEPPEGPAQTIPLQPSIIPVIKADAYGHGVVRVASALADFGVEMLAVGVVEEGIVLRRAGISQEILVMSTTWQGQERLALEHDLVLSFDSATNLKSLDIAAERMSVSAPVHMKVDTGMGRLGVRWDSVEKLLDALKASERISLKGVFSHLSSADEEDPAYTMLQKERFEQALLKIRSAGLNPENIHFPNSAGFLYHESLRQWSSRIGIALYGYAPGMKRSSMELQPVLSLKTKVGPIRRAERGESIGYNRKFTAARTTRYATLPIGYADGLPQRLSGDYRVIVREDWAELIGAVSMDMVTIDLTDRPDVFEGDEVILLGSSGNCSVTAAAWAEILGTIPYEVLCGMAARIPRIYI